MWEIQSAIFAFLSLLLLIWVIKIFVDIVKYSLEEKKSLKTAPNFVLICIMGDLLCK